jgi:hypothetical protein
MSCLLGLVCGKTQLGYFVRLEAIGPLKSTLFGFYLSEHRWFEVIEQRFSVGDKAFSDFFDRLE